MTTLRDYGSWGNSGDVPFCSTAQEVLERLEPALAGKEVGYFRHIPLPLEQNPAIGDLIDKVMALRPGKVQLFQVDSRGWAAGDALMASRRTRDRMTIEAMMVDA